MKNSVCDCWYTIYIVLLLIHLIAVVRNTAVSLLTNK